MMGNKTEKVEVAAHELAAIISVQYGSAIRQVIAVGLHLMDRLSQRNDGQINRTAS